MQIVPFDFESNNVRVVVRDGEPWFVGSDVCQALTIGNASMAIDRLDADEKGVSSIDTLGGEQEMTVINESGLYSLILTSRKTAAKRFKKWVTSEVLPSIRKTGGYTMLPKTFSEALQLAANQAKLLEEQRPMVEFAEAVMARGQDLSLTAAGKELGFGQTQWFKFLRDNKLITKRTYHASRNRPAEFNEAASGMVQAGYMVVKHEPDIKGIPRPQTFVTSQGLDWLRKLANTKKAA